MAGEVRHGCVAAGCLRGRREGRGEKRRKGREGQRHGARGEAAAVRGEAGIP